MGIAFWLFVWYDRGMKINIAIVEDSPEDKERLVGQLKQYEAERGDTFQIKWFPFPSQFLQAYEPIYEIVFMDIEMPGFNGLETAKLLRASDERVTLIFITNLAQYAINGYEVDAYDFIVKPVRYENLSRKLDRLRNRLDAKSKGTLSIKTKQGYLVIEIDDILYVESDNHKITFHLIDQTVSSFSSMKEIGKRLPEDTFVSCNQSYLVNMNYIEEINNYDLVLHGEKLIISRPKKKGLVEAFTAFLQGKL